MTSPGLRKVDGKPKRSDEQVGDVDDGYKRNDDDRCVRDLLADFTISTIYNRPFRVIPQIDLLVSKISNKDKKCRQSFEQS